MKSVKSMVKLTILATTKVSKLNSVFKNSPPDSMSSSNEALTIVQILYCKNKKFCDHIHIL